ncbi:chromate transporter [Christensenella timonensis]|uniref:chromate transporter n=1 Tax=Christensenella timonensis TaxID=1816678 RepID=UPI0008354734|nr:chromate transporter [Christensenella timonensis]
MEKKISLWWLFGINLFISAFTFGGGYVVVPMIRKYFVEKKQLFGEEELMNLAAVAQSSPGAIAVNLATVTGFSTAGKKGAFIGCIAAVIPPLIILTAVSVFYAAFRDNLVVAAALKGMEAGVCALVVDVVIDMGRAVFKEKQPVLSCLLPLSFVLVFFLQVNVIAVILGSAAVAFAAGWLKRRAGNGTVV